MNMNLFDRRMLEMALRTDFVSFIEKVVNTVNPLKPYQDNWHVWAIAWHLQQVLCGNIRRLIICLPPRHLKSIIASVALPAWSLGLDPSRKIISITYSTELAVKFALDFRRVIIDPWYLRAFPETRVSQLKNTETETLFTAGGFRLGTSTTGTLTGRGGDLIICDDLIKSQDVFSDARREANNQLFQNTILSRLDDKQAGAIVVVMQRLHANDFVGSLLQSSDHWTVLNLAAIAETDEQIRVGDDDYHFRKAGEPLHAAREPLLVLEQIRREIGPDAFAAHYQQSPVPPGGLMIKKEWIRYWSGELPTSTYGQVIQSWDTAGKEGARNAYSVCTTWLKIGEVYRLIDLVRGRFDYPTLRETAINCAKKHKPSVILVEDAATGTALAAELRKAVPHVVEEVQVHLSKENRLFEQTGKFASGCVLFPKDAPFMPELLKELLSFPQSKTSDQVDSISQALAYEGSTYTLANVR